MGKEIERKWLYNYQEFDIQYFLDIAHDYDLSYFDIRDHYFNKNCRLRHVKYDNYTQGEFYITIKSEGNLIRDEYEFAINRSEIDFLPTPVLVKRRYLFNDNNGLVYEVNFFRDLYIAPTIPLVLIELEMESPSLVMEPPHICGVEVTHDYGFYGYNLFSTMQEIRKRRIGKGNKKDNIIPFKRLDNK